MSLFVAVRPSLEALEDLEAAIDRVRRDPRAADLHWQPTSRWHVTMAFLGEASDDATDVAVEVLTQTAGGLPGSRIRLEGSGVFGRQILWVGVVGASDADGDALATSGRLIQARLRRNGLPLERRPWRPHLTVARTRHADARPAVHLLAGYSGPAWPVAELILVRSEGGPSPRHTVVHTVPVVSPPEPSGDGA